MIGIRFHRLAAKELRAAYGWYSVRNLDVADRFLTAIDKAAARIQHDPTSHPVELKHIRWVRVSRFPYRLMFEMIDDHNVLIIAVAHTSRRSRYWRRRTTG